MKTPFRFVIAFASLVPAIGFAAADGLNNSAQTLSLETAHHPCGSQVISSAEKDFAFYSNGTLSDGSPAIDCSGLRLLQRSHDTGGNETLDYQLRCYTLDRAVQRNYAISTQLLSSGECRQTHLSSEDDSP